jgi:hypothetical protein
MPLPFRSTIALALMTGVLGLGLAPAKAADRDDDGYGQGHHRDWDQGHWRGGGWDRRGWDDDGAAVGAAVGGFALGAAVDAVARPRHYSDCYIIDRPIRNGWGNVVDYRSVEVCD